MQKVTCAGATESRRAGLARMPWLVKQDPHEEGQDPRVQKPARAQPRASPRQREIAPWILLRTESNFDSKSFSPAGDPEAFFFSRNPGPLVGIPRGSGKGRDGAVGKGAHGAAAAAGDSLRRRQCAHRTRCANEWGRWACRRHTTRRCREASATVRRALGGGLGCLDGGTARVADSGADRAGSARTRAQLLLFLGVALEAPRLDHDASVACAGCVHAA